MQGPFDQNWHRQALAGQAEAVSMLAKLSLGPLFRFCLYRVGKNHHLCEDVVQETLVRAIRQLEQYDPARAGGNIFSWLVGLARNEIRRVLAGNKGYSSLETLWARMDKELLTVYARLEDTPFDEELLQRAETREMVNLTMSQIPPQYGAALEAKYILGKSVREIAAAWKVSEKAVESQLSRARGAFKATFLALTHHLPEIEINT